MALGEPLFEDTPTRGTLLVGTQNWVGLEMRMSLALPGGPGATDWKTLPLLDLDKYSTQAPDKFLLYTRIVIAKDPLLDYAKIVTDMEAQFRQDDVQALKRANLATAPDRPPLWVADAVPSDDVLKMLRNMDPVAQFVALRKVHEQIRGSGASPARIEALVRGYANLAFMTHTLYSGMYKSYMARSLLYAQRLRRA